MIHQFTGKYSFLSNFFIEPDGTHVEGEYQSAKCMSAIDKNRFIGLSPSASKKLGRKVTLRTDWEVTKLDTMYALVLKKFEDHLALAILLQETGHQELQEGNWWGDTFWGVCKGVGENHLGKILMSIRSLLL